MKSFRRALRLLFGLLRQTAPHIGVAGTLTLGFADDWNRLARLHHPLWCTRRLHVWPKGYGRSVTIRLGSSDFNTFRRVFVEQQYVPITKIENPEVIVECGANAAYPALFLLKHFPRTHVIAQEPDSINASRDALWARCGADTIR